jgi:hypothetical protein
VALSPGSRIGAYEIVAKLGAGGMGEVYRATDTRLGRNVAVKVLPADVARDADRRARFEREARAVAALSHPNILAIHDIGSDADTLFVVTELLDGETLADRLRQGALPVRKAIEVAIAVARGLSAAHDKGIAHRDLKPANIVLLVDGQVKILDFGLARDMSPASGATETQAALTDPGTVPGTAGYMAPEQIRGQQVDGRADLFALGVVLYEMLTGTRAFARETTAETLTAILKDDPQELTTARAELPPGLDRIVRHALEKSPAERFQSARDVIFALEALSGSGSSTRVARVTAGGSRAWLTIAGWPTAAVLAATTMAVLIWRIGPQTVPADPIFLEVAPPHLKFHKDPHPVISPDGKRVAFWAADADGRIAVWVRELSESKASAIAGSHLVDQEGQAPIAFGSDSRTILFSSNGKVRRAVVGGAAEEIGAAYHPLGFTQSADGTVLYVPRWRDALVMIAPGSRAPQPIAMRTEDGTDLFPAYPRFLPDGRYFLFLSISRLQVFVGDLQSRTAQLLVDTASPAQFANGHLLYVTGGLLMAQPFDTSTRTLHGEPRPIAAGVGIDAATFDSWSFSPSEAGQIVHWEGHSTPLSEPVWFGRDGRRQGAAGAAGRYLALALAPKTGHMALETFISEPRVNQTALLVGSAGGEAPIRIALDATARFTSTPVWTEDETYLWSAGFPGVVRVSTSGGSAQKTFDGDGFVQDSSPDGSLVVIEWDGEKTGVDLTLVNNGGAPKPFRRRCSTRANCALPRTAVGRRGSPTTRARTKSTCRRSPRPAPSCVCRKAAAGSRCGARMAASCSSCRPPTS